MTTASPFQLLPIGQVHESKHNPRQHFDGPALQQLAENIKAVGILEPLLVRPNAKGYELASGHRRYRAAKAIGLEELPCIVREMTDQVFMETVTIPNLQREDVHPLDEAKGYEALMAAPYKMDVHTIADRVGRSVKYIYDRVKLLALAKAARDLFWSGMIEAGHAILLARLTPTEQADVIGTKDDDYDDGGLFQAEHRLYDSEEEEEAAEERGPSVKARSVREVEAWIKEHIRFNAKQTDAFLFPETASQVTAAVESQRKIIEITHEYLAGDDVRHAESAKVYGSRAWQRADGKEDSKICDRSVLGVIASGPGRGDAFDVCVNKERCEVHWGKEIRAREKRAKDREKGITTTGRASTDGHAKQEQERARQHAAFVAREERWNKARPKILEAVAAAVKKAPTKATGLLGRLVLEATAPSAWHRQRVGKPEKYLALGKTADDLIRSAAFNVILDRAAGYQACEKFPKLAKAFGIDTGKILDKVAPSKAADKAGESKKLIKKTGRRKAA